VTVRHLLLLLDSPPTTVGAYNGKLHIRGAATMEKVEQATVFRSTQFLALLFSIIFFFIISYGYFNLLFKSGVFVALVGAAIMSTFAWYLARVIGTSPGGLRKNWLLLFPLVIVSSAGVYNTLMLYLEGSQIVSDTAESAQKRFGDMQRDAETALSQGGVTDHLGRVKTAADALFSEIRNPLNCGQGPEARRRVAELKGELPGFVELSNPNGGCEHNDEAIAEYTKKIAILVVVAPWNNPDLQSIASDSASARHQLDDLRASYTQNYNPLLLRQAVSQLETQQSNYSNLYFRLSRYTDAKDVPQDLDIAQVQSLGNIFKLPSLVIARMNRLTTYIYLLVAISFDLLMIYLFERLASMQVGRRPTKLAVGKAW